MLSSPFHDLSLSTVYSLLGRNWLKVKSGFLCRASLRDQQTDAGEAREVKRQNERVLVLRERQEDRG